MVSVTRIYDKFQTVIPSEIRREFNLNKSYNVEWNINENGKVELEFIKNLTLEDMIGRYSANEKINSVKLKHAFKNC
ncbi:AbrB/MazE/SpoVT family DNA-binding domain-containing protein [uncultured Methanobrevibacter sp.]|uniref:AbrB/MazE/SpoVT family DNA-binding domain-containing protein n=1 Tax=uncultured Methanobrevibacter sp. TaxID=253161 RepID=UPI00262A69F2|nr:AbrB/MazE/SpoVT family DNA-binding domain-containing protein [uncultured Methanobrevibacter sp.]